MLPVSFSGVYQRVTEFLGRFGWDDQHAPIIRVGKNPVLKKPSRVVFWGFILFYLFFN
jgi:hypothetical protein